MISWDFSASLFFFNVYYGSSLNESYWETPETVEVDDCGPPNLLSPGYTLWLILVPAIACVVQLPGSVFLYGRSNFFRFSPEMGLADCFGTLSLLVKALWKGYRWKESVAAVLLVREGIGQGELWWRAQRQISNPPSQSSSIDDADSSAVAASGDLDASARHAEYIIKARIKPYSEPISIERLIGAILFVLAAVKTIAIFCDLGSHLAVQVPALVALSYSASFVVLELLVWSLAIGYRGYSLEHIPADSLLELLRFVDPGDNPFTFPGKSQQAPTSTDRALELETTGQATSPSDTIPWNRAVACSAMLFGLFGSLLWAFILRASWSINKNVFYGAMAAVGIIGLRLVEKTLLLFWKLSITGTIFMPFRPWLLPFTKHLSQWWEKIYRRMGNDNRLFLIKWVFDRITTINALSVIWIVIICTSCIFLFPQYDLSGEGQPLERPGWLDWLG